tara:strand:- start:6546 stop:7355 length:810 start_codon:yes stop_codon:yes gene_type:complete
LIKNKKMYLLPQLKKETGQEAIFNFIKNGKIAESDIFKYYDGLSYTPSENKKVKTEALHELRNEILKLAKNNGFGNECVNRFRDFEYDVAISLSNCSFLWENALPTGEALRNNFWTYLTIVLLPDLAAWRWPMPQDGQVSTAWNGRIMGGTRNTFQRIFRRVLSFDRGFNHPERFTLIKNLMEDDFSAILERTSIGCNSKIAIALAEEFISMRKRHEDKNKQIQTLIYRESTKDLTAYGKVQSLDLLQEEDLKELISQVFDQKESQLLN